MRAEDLQGVIAAIPTPFDDADRLDVVGLKRVARYVLENGVHGIMTTGGTGEFPSLTREEKREVTRIVVKEVRGKLPTIAGTAACSTKETIALSQDAEEVGADAVIITPPYYFRLPEDALYGHYRDVASSIGIPVVLYNNPLYTGNNLRPQLVERLADIDGVIGIKQSNTDLGQFVEVARVAGDRISVCTGIDSQFYASLCVGGKGIFSTAAAVVPREIVRVYLHFMKQEHDQARNLHMQLQLLNKLLEYDPGYVSPCKDALNLLGIRVGGVRKPLPSLSELEREAIRQALAGLGYTVG